ncbi:Phosphatidylinositol transfer protein (PITP) [Marasmius crinis-equi]|uniref:Phosphatidylinositol transfer protein (PITP) n=1 Tax=Marasmius crinis-equi TaxID=585013 RepID=A0ABR3EL62_9AGAR
MSSRISQPILPPKGFAVCPTPALTSEQDQVQKTLQAHFSKDGYLIPGVEKKEGGLMEEEKFWLSYECQLRYLRATRWKLSQAIARLEATLKWRRDYGLYTHLTGPHVEPEGLTGKEIIFGYDVNGRPACYMLPSRQNTKESPRQVEYFVWMLERCIDLMDANVESVNALINFGDKAEHPSLAVARSILNIFQDHYPERLGKALIINVPFLITMFFKLLTPFMDPNTVQKLKFNPDVIKDGLFTPDMLVKDWGGNQDFEYKHEEYWPKLVELCVQRKKRWMENWRKLGGTVGISEVQYKSDGVPSPSLVVDKHAHAPETNAKVSDPETDSY